MSKSEIMYKVKNRSASKVVYKDPELKIRREFAPGETKLISYEELEKLSFIPGGREMMANFLQLEPVAVKAMGIHAEPEYYMSEEQVREMLIRGSLDQFLDCLDFAPEGVKDLIKKLSVTLPLTDIKKRRALKEKLGFDVDAALRHIEEEKIEEQETSPRPVRRVQPSYEDAPKMSSRRTNIDYEAEAENNMADESIFEPIEVDIAEKKTPAKRGRKPAVRSVDVELAE